MSAAKLYNIGYISTQTISGNEYQFVLASGNEYSQAYVSGQSIRGLATQEAIITTPLSGQTLTYKQNNSRWENTYPSITFSVSNVFVSANCNLNLARFNTGAGHNCYLWQANCASSGGVSISGLCVQLLQGTTNIYKTSSATIEQGNPLGAAATGDLEIRIMYSGTTTLTGGKYGTAFMNVSIY